MSNDKELRLKKVCEFLEKNNWSKIGSGNRFIVYRSPDELGFTEPYDIHLPINLETHDFDSFLNRNINLIAEIYEISPHKVCEEANAQDTILSVRLVGEKTLGGTFPINSMKDVLDNVTNAIRNAANFVAYKSDNAKVSNSSIEDFIEKCRFLQTEIGSFIIKIQIPSNEILKEDELLENKVYSDEVGNEISSTINFVKEEIFNDDIPIESDEYLADNYQKHSYKILSNISSILEKCDVDKIEFTFIKNNVSSYKIEMDGFKGKKLQKLKKFNTRLNKFIKNNIPIEAIGKIVELSSKNPTSNENHATLLSNNKKYSMNLNKNDYEKAINAHIKRFDVKIKGLADKSSKNLKITKLDCFEIIQAIE